MKSFFSSRSVFLTLMVMATSAYAQPSPSAPPPGFTIQLVPPTPKPKKTTNESTRAADAKKLSGPTRPNGTTVQTIKVPARRHSAQHGKTTKPFDKLDISAPPQRTQGQASPRVSKKVKKRSSRSKKQSARSRKRARANQKTRRIQAKQRRRAKQRKTTRTKKLTREKRRASSRNKKVRRKMRSKRVRLNRKSTTKTAKKRTLNDPKRPFARRSRWGIIDAVSPSTAAYVRSLVDGTERVYDTELKFQRRSNSLTAQSKAILSALADYLEVKPSIMLVMLEGHADDEKNNRKNHDLSEARASVVRDYLISRGMSPQRAIAFGFGQAHRTSKKRGLNRRVVIRLVSGQMRRPVAATRWEQLGVTHLRGVAIVRKGSNKVEEDKAAWKPLAVRQQFEAPATIRTLAKSHVLLRAPDNTQLKIHDNSEVYADRIRSPAPGQDLAAVLRIPKGRLEARVNDRTGGISRLTVFSPLVTVVTSTADFEIMVGQRKGWLSVRRGTVRVRTKSGLELTLGSGQNLVLLPNQQSVWAQIPAPLIDSPRSGAFVHTPTLAWKTAPKALAYRVEIAKDVAFNDLVADKTVTINRWVPDSLAAMHPYFWRVTPIDERSAPGHPSKVYHFKIQPKTSNKVSSQ